MFLQVVIVVFADTSCTAEVIGKALDTSTLYRQQMPAWSKTSIPGYRHLTPTYSTLALKRDKCLNAKGEHMAVLSVPPATHLPRRSIHLS